MAKEIVNTSHLLNEKEDDKGAGNKNEAGDGARAANENEPGDGAGNKNEAGDGARAANENEPGDGAGNKNEPGDGARAANENENEPGVGAGNKNEPSDGARAGNEKGAGDGAGNKGAGNENRTSNKGASNKNEAGNENGASNKESGNENEAVNENGTGNKGAGNKKEAGEGACNEEEAVDPHAPKSEAHQAKQKPISTLPLFALNHISFLVEDLNQSARFYQKVMGFVVIQRPDVFSFQGSWMFGHGVSVHLLGLGGKGHDNKCGNGGRKILHIDNHVSFQCSNLHSMMRTLETSSIKPKRYNTVVGGKTVVDRIVFHDPDGNMIEITNSQNLPIVPSASWPPESMPTPNLEFVSSTRRNEIASRAKYNKCKCDSVGKEEEEEKEDINTTHEHHLLAMNHIGHIVQSLEESLKFYREVLEFVNIELPHDENLENCTRARLFGHGIGIHLMEAKKHEACGVIGRPIDPQDNHISFQCTNMYSIVRRLDEMKIDYVAMDIKEDGAIVNQIFFHDPDGNMIEFCNCQDLPVVPISACPPRKMPTPNLDFSNKELACKPSWPLGKRNKVEEDEEDLCNKRQTKGVRRGHFNWLDLAQPGLE